MKNRVNVVSMLVHRLRRWPSIKITSGECILFAVIKLNHKVSPQCTSGLWGLICQVNPGGHNLDPPGSYSILMPRYANSWQHITMVPSFKGRIRFSPPLKWTIYAILDTNVECHISCVFVMLTLTTLDYS